jgi:hypothetical protein
MLKQLSSFAVLVALIASFFVGTSVSHAQAQINLQYVINIFGSDLGRLYTQIDRQEDTFKIKSITKAEGAASLLMGGDLLQECQFDIQAGKIVSRLSSADKQGRDAFKNAIELDYAGNKIAFLSESEKQYIDIPDGYVVDSCNFQFAAAYTNIDILKATTTYVLDGRKSRIKGYVFKSQSQERLKTAIGTFDTTKIVLERELNPEKQFIFWVSKEHPYFPLKMLDKRKTGSRTMSIRSAS